MLTIVNSQLQSLYVYKIQSPKHYTLHLIPYRFTKFGLPVHAPVVNVHGSGAVEISVVEHFVPPASSNEGTNMAVGEWIVEDEIATHLEGKEDFVIRNKYNVMNFPMLIKNNTIVCEYFFFCCDFATVRINVKLSILNLCHGNMNT